MQIFIENIFLPIVTCLHFKTISSGDQLSDNEHLVHVTAVTVLLKYTSAHIILLKMDVICDPVF